MLYDAIKKLVQYGINTGITPESERIYTTNLLLDLFHEDNYEDVDCDLNNLVLEDILAELLDIAAERGIIENSIPKSSPASKKNKCSFSIAFVRILCYTIRTNIRSGW